MNVSLLLKLWFTSNELFSQINYNFVLVQMYSCRLNAVHTITIINYLISISHIKLLFFIMCRWMAWEALRCWTWQALNWLNICTLASSLPARASSESPSSLCFSPPICRAEGEMPDGSHKFSPNSESSLEPQKTCGESPATFLTTSHTHNHTCSTSESIHTLTQ